MNRLSQAAIEVTVGVGMLAGVREGFHALAGDYEARNQAGVERCAQHLGAASLEAADITGYCSDYINDFEATSLLPNADSADKSLVLKVPTATAFTATEMPGAVLADRRNHNLYANAQTNSYLLGLVVTGLTVSVLHGRLSKRRQRQVSAAPSQYEQPRHFTVVPGPAS